MEQADGPEKGMEADLGSRASICGRGTGIRSVRSWIATSTATNAPGRAERAKPSSTQIGLGGELPTN